MVAIESMVNPMLIILGRWLDLADILYVRVHI